MKRLEEELVSQANFKHGIELVLWTEEDEPLGVEISPGLFLIPDEVESPDVPDSIDS